MKTCERHGGTVANHGTALWRDETKLQAYQAGKSLKPTVDIYSLAGKKLLSVQWDKGPVKGLGWSDDETLLIVAANGEVSCYDLQGDFSTFSLGHGADKYGVESCAFHNDGMVALLGNTTFIAVSSYTEPRPAALATPPSGEIQAWSIMPPEHTLSRTVEVLANIGSTVFAIDATECEDRYVDFGALSHISVSPDGMYINLYSTQGKAHIISSDFQDQIMEHESDSKTPPLYVGWCGSDAIIAWEDELHIIGQGSESSTYIYDATRIHIISERDGARVITNDFCEFIERVPDATLQAFGASTESSPAAILLDAVGQLELGSPKADDYIQLIRPNLTEAVDTCVNAAGREFDAEWQKRLLKAASFGKSVLDIYNSDEFVEMCETLRVLNAVRFYKVGLGVSFEQFHRLTPENLIKRLLNRHEYLLALKIASYLKLPSDRIYIHWAAAKVRSGTEDEDTICRLVVERLSGKPGISFEEIARAANHEGRTHLATELLNHEPRGGKQVPLLLEMDQDDIALDKAIESGDTDLIACVLFHLKKKHSLSEFFRIINSRPTASALVEAGALLADDTAMLKDLYYQDDRRVDGANVFIRESLRQPDSRTASDKLALAGKLLSDSKDSAVETIAIKEAMALLRLQDALERDLTDKFTGLSVNETMSKLIHLGYHSRAKKIQSEFRVPEKVAWWIRLRALVAKREWSEIEDIAKNKKSPIGWEPFYNLILQAGNPRLASQFVGRCLVATGETITMYEKCGMRVKAAEEAVRLKDAESWQRLLQAAGRATPEGREIEKLGATVFAGR